jgi:Mu-like prophage major head subunit gpT
MPVNGAPTSPPTPTVTSGQPQVPAPMTPPTLPTSQQQVSVSASTVQITDQQQQAMLADMQRFTEQQAQLSLLVQQTQIDRAQVMLERRLMESILPGPVQASIRQRFTGRVFEAEELDKAINDQQDMLAALTAQGLIRGMGYEKPGTVMGMISEAEKVQAAFDRLFDLDIDTARLGNIKGFEGIHEAYARVTGDASVAGGISGASRLGQIRVSEAAPITRITETDTTTASFSYLLGTSMNKRLLKDYQAWPAEWMKFCTIAPIRDFKQQTRVRFGAFGSLSTVPEDTAYTAVTLTDSAATYVPQKRGNLVSVSRETIINDDLQAIKQIPTKLAVAAAYTLAEFVYTFLSGNGNIYDGNALFTSGGGSHLNLGSSALSSASMQTGVTAMREQVNYAGKRIGLRPRYLIVPPELEWTAMVVTKSAGVPGSANNDINPMLGYVTPIVSPQLSSTTQWFMATDPREIDTIEVGFVGGQVNPALFIQDQPLFGLNFTQDVISYKIRHEYGGAVMDYRGLYRGI